MDNVDNASQSIYLEEQMKARSSQISQDPEGNKVELDPLTPNSLKALQRLARYKPVHDSYESKFRRAAVLVILFSDRVGQLRVILSTRSPKLRSHPGEVCLPGGKMDSTDINVEYTARREAFEEIGLPMDSKKVRYLTTLPPHLSRSTNMIVTPVVVFLLDPFIKPKLNLDEVDEIFSHPLESFLFEKPKEPVLHILPPEVQDGRVPYHRMWDLNWLGDAPYRYHAFISKKRDIRGFTTNILIDVAELAYNRKPEFQRKSPGQLPRRKLFQLAIEEEEQKSKL